MHVAYARKAFWELKNTSCHAENVEFPKRNMYFEKKWKGEGRGEEGRSKYSNILYCSLSRMMLTFIYIFI